MANIIDLLKGNQDAVAIINLSDLQEFANIVRRDAIEDAKREQEQQDTPDDSELLTTTETARFLNIDRSTLYRWSRDGYLHPVSIGNVKRYRRKDLIKFKQEGAR